jgi:hypothetical protein
VLLAPGGLFVWIPLLALAVLATLANILGVRDMVKLGGWHRNASEAPMAQR